MTIKEFLKKADRSQITWKQISRIYWCTFMTAALSLSLFDGSAFKEISRAYRRITLWSTVEDLLVVLVVLACGYSLYKFCGPCRWSWLCLVATRTENGERENNGQNLNLAPLRVPWLGLVFGALLLINLPLVARWEEEIFRSGTASWLGDWSSFKGAISGGIARSVLFGFCHCIAGVPIGAGAAISIAGLWYTYQYFLGGVELSAAHHATYNAILLSVVYAGLIAKHVSRLLPGDPLAAQGPAQDPVQEQDQTQDQVQD